MTYKYIAFAMTNGEIARKLMMSKLEVRIKDKLHEPTTGVEVFEAMN